MRPELVEVLRRLERKLPSGWALAGSDPEAGTLAIAREDHVHTLRFNENHLAGDLRAARRDAKYLWGPDVDAAESLARLIAIHLEESLATRRYRPGAVLVYREGFFHAE